MRMFVNVSVKIKLAEVAASLLLFSQWPETVSKVRVTTYKKGADTRPTSVSFQLRIRLQVTAIVITVIATNK